MKKSSFFIELGTLFFIIFIVVFIFISIFEKADFQNLVILDQRTLNLLKFSIYQAILSTIISISLGVVLAWALHYRQKFLGRRVLISLISASLVIPSLIVAFGIIGVFGRSGWISQILSNFGVEALSIYGIKGIILAHVYLNGSFATKALLHALDSIPLNRYKLSASLDLSLWQRFKYIDFLAMTPTIKTLFVTIFLLCFTSFAIVLLLGGGPQNSTLEVAIYEAIKIDFNLGLAIKYTLIQLSISILIISFLSKKDEDITSLKSNYVDLWFLDKRSHEVIEFFIIAVASLFFILPLFNIFLDGFDGSFKRVLTDELFIKSFFTSIFIATVSALFSLILTLLIADLKRTFTLPLRLQKSKLSYLAKIIIELTGNIYFAISSLVLGLGFFLISLKYHIDQGVMAWFALIFANVLLTLPFSLSVIYPLLYKIGSKYDRLNYALDLGLKDEWFKVILPHLKSSLIYVFALSFCFSLGDLGIIALFGNENFSTLPWYLYGLLGSYHNSDASVTATVLLVLTLVVFLGGEYIANRKRS